MKRPPQDGDGLFEWGEEQARNVYGGMAPFVKGSDTSEAAARSQDGKRATVRGHIRDFIADRAEYGATRDEIEEALGIRASGTTSPRVCELVLMEVIVDSGRRRLTRWGRFAVVYVLTKFAPAGSERKPAPIAQVGATQAS